MTNLESLTAKIQKACPELLELSLDEVGDYVILGNPIQLQHVLKAIAASGMPKAYVTALGYLCFDGQDSFGDDPGVQPPVWDLAKGLSEQSEAVISWLNNVIK